MERFTEDTWRDLADKWAELRRLVGFATPLGNLPPWMAPALALGGMIALALTAGIAVVALGTLLAALLVAYLLLDRVFGVSVEPVPLR